MKEARIENEGRKRQKIAASCPQTEISSIARRLFMRRDILVGFNYVSIFIHLIQVL